MNRQSFRTIHSFDPSRARRSTAAVQSKTTAMIALTPTREKNEKRSIKPGPRIGSLVWIGRSLRSSDFETRQMRRVFGDQRAQHGAGYHVADKMIIHRHKAHEHRSGEHRRYNSGARHRNHPNPGESENSAGVP